ncbi:hypothetical protein TNCV_3729701 [Trichonephila clavipes]|nr:hypothetical protein TNCV_3729701 [Trichonephila clavipes]
MHSRLGVNINLQCRGANAHQSVEAHSLRVSTFWKSGERDTSAGIKLKPLYRGSTGIFEKFTLFSSPAWCSNLRLMSGVHLDLCHDEFRGSPSDIVRLVALVTATTSIYM